MFKFRSILAIAAIASLSACLDNDLERGLAGAAVGAIAADVVGVDPITGALVGGATGVLCDELTSICR
jgi:osmotically inducible lipoprotein OsmB